MAMDAARYAAHWLRENRAEIIRAEIMPPARLVMPESRLIADCGLNDASLPSLAFGGTLTYAMLAEVVAQIEEDGRRFPSAVYGLHPDAVIRDEVPGYGDVLTRIDAALEDWEHDAMRWRPE